MRRGWNTRNAIRARFCESIAEQSVCQHEYRRAAVWYERAVLHAPRDANRMRLLKKMQDARIVAESFKPRAA